MRREFTWLAVVLCAGACSRDSAPRSDSTAARHDSTAVVRSGRPSGNAASPSMGMEPVRVTEQGVGPIRLGMTMAEARSATAKTLIAPPTADTAACGYFQWPRGLPGVRFMTAAGRIVRIDVDSGKTATAVGAHIGDSEAHISELYAGRVETTPAKYTKGHLLTIKPSTPADSAYRIVFETDGSRVTRYRAGKLPQVGYVEGCG